MRKRGPNLPPRAVLNTSETDGKMHFQLSCGHTVIRPANRWGCYGRRSDPNLERMGCAECAKIKA
jgi:hypothetical protein